MKNLILTSPIPGELIALNKVKDPAFSSGAMGAVVSCHLKAKSLHHLMLK